MFKASWISASSLIHFQITSLLLVSALEFSPKHLPGLLCLTAGAHANSHYCCWSHHFSPYCFDLLLFWVWIWNPLYIPLHTNETFCLKGVWKPPFFQLHVICIKLIYISLFFIQWPLSPSLFLFVFNFLPLQLQKKLNLKAYSQNFPLIIIFSMSYHVHFHNILISMYSVLAPGLSVWNM